MAKKYEEDMRTVEVSPVYYGDAVNGGVTMQGFVNQTKFPANGGKKRGPWKFNGAFIRISVNTMGVGITTDIPIPNYNATLTLKKILSNIQKDPTLIEFEREVKVEFRGEYPTVDIFRKYD